MPDVIYLMFFMTIQVGQTSALKYFGKVSMHNNSYKLLNVGTIIK